MRGWGGTYESGIRVPKYLSIIDGERVCVCGGGGGV